jgi:hypothetical protein
VERIKDMLKNVVNEQGKDCGDLKTREIKKEF